MLFPKSNSRVNRKDGELTANERIEQFACSIRDQQDLLYGIALFFEGINLLCKNRDVVLSAQRERLSEIIQRGNNAMKDATDLLEQARKDKTKVDLLEAFSFPGCRGHDRPDDLDSRARHLVEVYDKLFPRRPRGQAFSTDEILRLVESASDTFKMASTESLSVRREEE